MNNSNPSYEVWKKMNSDWFESLPVNCFHTPIKPAGNRKSDSTPKAEQTLMLPSVFCMDVYVVIPLTFSEGSVSVCFRISADWNTDTFPTLLTSAPGKSSWCLKVVSVPPQTDAQIFYLRKIVGWVDPSTQAMESGSFWSPDHTYNDILFLSLILWYRHRALWGRLVLLMQFVVVSSNFMWF